MKKYLILSLAALAALVSCQKENFQNDTVSNEPLVFTASIAQDDTKATVDIAGSTAKILWEATDKITITDGSSHVAVYKVSTGAGKKTATFVKDSGDDLDSPGTYTATFGEAPSTTLSQPYSGTSVPVYMTAPSTSDPDNLCFTVQGGVLKLTLTKSGEQARKIVISNASGSYTLACTSPVDLSSGATFYMNLPAGTYNRMAVYDGNCKVAERTSLNMVIKENTLLPASTSTLEFNTIRVHFLEYSPSTRTVTGFTSRRATCRRHIAQELPAIPGHSQPISMIMSAMPQAILRLIPKLMELLSTSSAGLAQVALLMHMASQLIQMMQTTATRIQRI
jgi:hypothetical protein